jgi:putative FmdB family regulatory protein
MPIYDYVCSACGHRFEVLRGLNEAGPGQCPLCEGPVTRAFAPPTIVFKGSGWAKVDRRYSGAPTRKAPSGEGSGGGGEGRGSSGEAGGSGGPGTGGEKRESAAGGEKREPGAGGEKRESSAGRSGKAAAPPTTGTDG